MALLRVLLSLLVIGAAVVLGALFTLQNTAPVPLDLLVVQLSERAVALWVLLFFAAGCVVGLLGGAAVNLKQRAGNARLRRQHKKLELEVDRLRRFGLSESD
ncbi:LapA family protein [Luminiphilus sp. nBUS_16]|uniref:LapA family protein n=1 Tax=Luminiphilus sp. nBUS_16 TaxID=3395315 RepID=UPI003EB8C886